MSLEQVDAILSEGGRFVVFEFAVSFVMFTISRPSKVWLVRSAEDAQRAAKRYTIITMLFGWWALPFGPQRTWRVLKVNRGGGTDVTSDVRGALTEETVKLGVVRFEEETDLYQMFDHVDGSDRPA